jgi:hypothetical protein
MIQSGKVNFYLLNKASVGDVVASQITKAISRGVHGDFKPHKPSGFNICQQIGDVDFKSAKSSRFELRLISVTSAHSSELCYTHYSTAASIKKLGATRAADMLAFHKIVPNELMAGALPQ